MILTYFKPTTGPEALEDLGEATLFIFGWLVLFLK